MIDRAHAVILWPVAATGTAATLATLSPSLAELPWSIRFGCEALAILTSGGLVWLLLRRAAPASLSEFLSVADHEMKTPLAGIKAYVELLADGDADDAATQEEFLRGISSQTERLERTIDELLELARTE